MRARFRWLILIPLVILLVLHGIGAAQDPLTTAGYDHFYNLEYDEALKAFQQQAVREPSSPDAYNYIAQAIVFREMYRSGALETQLVSGTDPFLRRARLNPTEADQKEFFDALGRAMELSAARIKRNSHDTAALYAMSVSYALRSNYNFLVRKAWIDSLRDASSAHEMEKRASEADPGLIDARMLQGVYDYVVGSLPLHLRVLGFVAGFHGDRERGINTLKQVVQEGRVNRVESEFLLCVILRRERRAAEAIPFLDDLIQRFPRNFLLRLELVQMYGDLGKKAEALAVIDQVAQLKRTHAPGFDMLPEEKILYSRGTLFFWYNDLDPALEDMRAVTAKASDLDQNTGVYSWMRLGQIYDLKGLRPQAIAAYQEAVRYAPGSDAARESKEYIVSRYRR